MLIQATLRQAKPVAKDRLGGSSDQTSSGEFSSMRALI